MIAVFAVDNALISQDLYASVVLAILMSTILAPFALRITISWYNKVTEKAIKEAEELEKMRQELKADPEDLIGKIVSQHSIFLCIQTRSESAWGLIPKIMNALSSLKLEIIDHRSWNPRGVNTTLVNEIYAKDSIEGEVTESVVEARLYEVQLKLVDAIAGSSCLHGKSFLAYNYINNIKKFCAYTN